MKLVIAALVMVLSGCGGINDAGIKSAIKACEPFGGIERLSPLAISSGQYDVKCKDGKTIMGNGDVK